VDDMTDEVWRRGDVDAAKRALRADARAARAAAGAADPESWSRVLLSDPLLAEADVVAAYTSYGTEPPTGALIRALLRRGTRVLLPVLCTDRDLDWVQLTFEADVPDVPLRAETVTATVGRLAIGLADAVVVPALLVGRDGARLGQGGGSYDRALTRVAPEVPVIALVRDDEFVAAGVVPIAEHDRPASHVVTPTALHALDRPPNPRWDQGRQDDSA
jgi:5-formyltetrahydrofolate cyclo-ligase